MHEIAEAELTQFLKDARKEYRDNRQSLASKLGLSDDELSTPRAAGYFYDCDYEPF